jgi:hypothetical protein
LIDVKNREVARKRIPKEKLVPLDKIEPLELPQTIAQSAPEDSFNYAWVSALLEQVLDEVEATCREDGKTIYWKVFHDRILQPIKNRTEPPSLRDVCDRYGIQDDTKASNIIVTVKRRFQTALRKQLRDSVVSEEQVNGELEELRKFFPKIAQDDR